MRSVSLPVPPEGGYMNNMMKAMVAIIAITMVASCIIVVGSDSEVESQTMELEDNASITDSLGTINNPNDALTINLKEGCTYSLTGKGFQGSALTINGNGATVEVTMQDSNVSEWITSSAHGSVSIDNVKFVLAGGQTLGQSAILYLAYFSEVSVTNCTFERIQFAVTTTDSYPNMAVSLKECEWCIPNGESAFTGYYALTANGHNVSISDCSINGYDRGINAGILDDGGSISITNTKLANILGKCALQFSGAVGNDNASFSGCTFTNCVNAVSIHETVSGNGTIISAGNKYDDIETLLLYSVDGSTVSKATMVSINDTVKSVKNQIGGEEAGVDLPMTAIPVDEWYTPGQDMTITTADEFRQFAIMVNSGNDFYGEKITLGSDITLSGEWTPIGEGSRDGGSFSSDSTPFRGTFDGQGKSISGLNITQTEGADYAIGLFGVVAGGTVRNVILLEVNISCSDSELAGAVVGLLTEGGTISSVTVGVEDDNSIVSANKGVGGIVGRLLSNGNIESCTNYASITSSSGNTGGIVGAAYYLPSGVGLNIDRCVNHGSVTCTTGGYTGGIVGLSSADISECTNNGGVKASSTSVGGIVGEQKNAGTIAGCINNGAVVNHDVDGASSGNATGGIVGWIRYFNDGNFTNNTLSTVEVTDCTNNASVSSDGNFVGGIVGDVHHSAVVEGCLSLNEKSGTVSGENFVGGLIGGVQYDGAIPTEGTHVRVTGNTCGGTITQSGSTNFGNLAGQILSSTENATGVNDTLATVYGNTVNTTGADSDVAGGGASVATVVIDGVEYGYTTITNAIEHASSKSTVTIQSDVNESITIPSGKELTLDLNGYRISNTEGHHTITNNGTLIITDNTESGTGTVDNISHARASVYNTGTLTIQGGTFTRSEEVIVSDESPNSNSWYLVYNVGTATINDGLFYTGDLETRSFGNMSSLIINGYDESEGTLTINGGEFHNAANVIRNFVGTVTINDGSFTMDNTVNQWAGGNNLIQAEGATTVNGGTFSALGDGTGILSADSTYNRYLFTASGTDDTDVLNGGDFYAEGEKTYLMYNSDGGSMSVEAGHYKVGDGATLFRENQDTTAPSVTGGSFSTEIPESYIPEGYDMIETSDGYSTTYVGTEEEPAVASIGDVDYKTFADAVANAADGDVVTLNVSTSTDRVNVRTDITIDLGQNTLTLNGTASSVGIFVYGNVTIQNGTIEDSRSQNVQDVDGRIMVATNGDLELDNVTLKQYDPMMTDLEDSDYNYIVYVQNGGSLTTTGTTTLESVAQEGFPTYGTVGIVVLGTGGNDVTDLTVNDGTTVDTSGFAISGNGTMDGTKIDILGGSIISGTTAVYHPQEGDITVSGGSLTAPTGLQFTGAGKVTISGGTITATGESVESPYKDPDEGDGAIMDGAALSIVTRGGGYQSDDAEIIVEITGGILVSENNYAVVDYRYLKVNGAWVTGNATGIEESRLTSIRFSGDVVVEGYKGAINDEATDTYSISGGTYSSLESNLMADGFTMVSNADGTYGAVESPISDAVIDSDGDSVSVEASGESVTITSNGTYSDVTISVVFGERTVTIKGNVTDDVTVTFREIEPDDGSDFAFDLDIQGMIVSGSESVVIVIPVEVADGCRIESAFAYSYLNGEKMEEEVIQGDDYVTVVTNHNTPFHVGWTIAEIPGSDDRPVNPPITDDDDEYVPLPPQIVVDDSSSDEGDDTISIVACAAAAVVAALMAVFLILAYRRQ